MRDIERSIMNAMTVDDGISDFEASISIRDRILCFDNKVSGKREHVYLFHGTVVARLVDEDGKLILGTPDGSWQTVTTKSRINAFSRHFNVQGICQRKYRWYWEDGQEYDGARIFDLTGKGE